MNDVQKKSFELFQLFIGICEKWNLEYYLVCGSALGAVKYHGFIPWDDDIDVALLRKDYERFLEIASQELPDYCFLQNRATDPAYPNISAKLRNSNTTFIQIGIEHLNMNHGIYIDIFPIDGYPNTVWKRPLFEIRKKLYQWQIFCCMSKSANIKVEIRNKLFRILGYHKRTGKTLNKLEKLYCKYPPEEADIWCNHANSVDKSEYAPQWYYGKGIWATFEGLKVRIPENYDAYLTQKYGEWRKDPPKEKQKSHHTAQIIDTEKSYKYYLEENL